MSETPGFSSAAVIGTGMMGPGIAVTLALGGIRTTIVSRSADGAAAGLEKAHGQLRALEEHGLEPAERVREALGKLGASAAFDDAIAGAELVIESGPEDLEFKRAIFARMDAVVSPGAVLATNTSGLSVTAIASRCRAPQRVLTTHFWNPPHLMPLVEMVKGEQTSDDVLFRVRAALRRCGKVAVLVKKDRPGQLGNRLQMALWREAVHIVAEGIAEAEDVDLAARLGFGFRLPAYGIFEHADVVGLAMALGIMDYVSADLFNEPRAPDLMRRLVESGRTGVRSGQGFYDWSKKDLAGTLARRDRLIIDLLRSGLTRA